MSIAPLERVENRDETQELPRRVVTALESTRRSLGRFQVAMTLAALILSFVAGCVVIAVADVSWVLPTWLRGSALAFLGLAGIVEGLRSVVRSRRKLGPLETASEIESAFPELGQRVRTTLEYLEPRPDTMPASPSLVEALAVDTDRLSEPLRFSTIIPWSKLTRRLLSLAAVAALIVIATSYDRNLAIAACRVFLIPVHYSTLAVEPGDQTLKAGSEFTLKTTWSGRPVRDAQWLRRPSGNNAVWVATPLGDPSKSLIGNVEAGLKDCQSDFDYQVVAGEVVSGIYHVKVTHPLALKSFEARIDPPSYTRLKPSVAKAGDFEAPEGSKIQLAIGLDRPPASARISWTSTESKSPQVLNLKVNGNQLTGELPPVSKDLSYQIQADAADGMRLEPLSYKIKVKPDSKPTIQFSKPTEIYAATPTTDVAIKLQTGDDYGVAKVGITYRVGDGPEATLYLDDPKNQPLSVDVLTTLYLEKHKLTIADSLSYRGFVEDNREPGPQRVTTELRFIDILPYKQDYQLVPGGPPSNGSSVTLEELILRQRINLNRTLAHGEDNPVEESVADKLSKNEAELAMATGEFASRLTSEFGPINPLDDAVKAMQAATVSLASKDLATSSALEQTAMASLVKARQNLRKLMTSSATAGQCQKIDRQQREQKIRKPPAEQAKEADLAKLEQEIRKLAEAQKKFAESVDPKTGPEARLDRQNEPKASQAASAKEAGRLSSLAKQDKALTDLAKSRMDEAAKSVEKANQAIQAEQAQDAAKDARAAAEQLERLAEQVAALKADELADRIGKARDLARSTAKEQRDLAGRGPEPKPQTAQEQQALAENAKTLADILKKAQADATDEDRTLAQALEKASSAHSPEEIEQAMRQASAEIESGQTGKSVRSMKQAETQLDGLATDLETARRAFTQPKLQQLLAAEKQAAETQKALESANSEARKGEAEKALGELGKTLQALKSGDAALRQAADNLAKLGQPSGTNAWTPPQKNGTRPGFYKPPISFTKGVGEAAQALQAWIQALIVNDALVDRDGPVPPGYKQKVEDYFRVLSEDLR